MTEQSRARGASKPQRVTLAEMAASLGVTEDALKARMADAPRRMRETMERLTNSPQVQDYIRRMMERQRNG